MLGKSTFLALMSVAVLPALAADVAIELRPDAVVAGAVYRLEEIATVSGDDPSAIRQLGATRIGVAPRPGHSERLSQQQVSRFIEANAPEWRGKLRWSGSKATTVRAAGVVIEKQRLIQVATEFLSAGLAGRYDKVEITPVGNVRELTLPAGAELRPRALSRVVSRRMAVWIDMQAGGRPYGAVPVWFSVQAWKQVPVARVDLPAGSEVRPGDFSMESRDVAQTANLLDRLPPGGMRLRTAIARGLPVSESALELIPAISRNQEVAIRIATGGILIETAGVAQGNGRIGERVKVKNAGSNEIFLAEVVEPGVVSVNAR